MRFLPIVICICLASAIAGMAEAQAQTPSINGPLVGFLPDEAGASIFPIIGIPGASLLTTPIQLNAAIRRAVIAPKQDYALAIRNSDASVVVVDLAGTSVLGIDGVQQHRRCWLSAPVERQQESIMTPPRLFRLSRDFHRPPQSPILSTHPKSSAVLPRFGSATMEP